MLPVQPDPPRAEYLLNKIEKCDLPRERLARLGPSALKNEELLAILLRTGSPGENVLDLAERLLRESRLGRAGAHAAFGTDARQRDRSRQGD